MKVVKFGGSSLANAENIRRAAAIVLEDSGRSFVVVSAPGKCPEHNRKITDLLIDAHTKMCFEDKGEGVEIVLLRFAKIAERLGVDISVELERVREEICINRCDYDFVISRGEYLMAILFAKVLGYKFLDAAEYIVIKKNGTADIESTRKNFSKLAHGKYVLGGFYGTNGTRVKTFARGGSDYSGAVAAVCLNADVYENFTDTYGVQSANPSIVKDTQTVTEIDYATLHSLSKAGASVIYPNCLPLLKKHSVPLRVDNTFDHGRKSTIVTCKKASRPFFSITYETGHNINKETATILVIMHKMCIGVGELTTLFRDKEVYLTSFKNCEFRLITPAVNVSYIVNLLHKTLAKNI